MEVSPDIYALSRRILKTFDAKKIKEDQLDTLQKQSDALQGLEAKKGESIQESTDRWKKIAAKVDIEETIEETKQADFDQQQKDYMGKLMGCSKDHAKEIDLYNKSYKDKLDHVRQMVKQAELAVTGSQDEDALQKASYFYTQAMLVFYYLIPDNPQEERESELLKAQCRLAHAGVYKQQRRNTEALKELAQTLAEIALYCKHCPNDQQLFSQTIQAAYSLKARVLLDVGDYDGAMSAAGQASETDQLKIEIQTAKEEHAEQERAMYKKMVAASERPEQQVQQVQEPAQTVQELKTSPETLAERVAAVESRVAELRTAVERLVCDLQNQKNQKVRQPGEQLSSNLFSKLIIVLVAFMLAVGSSLLTVYMIQWKVIKHN